MPVKVSAGVPTSSVSATAEVAAAVEIQQQLQHRRGHDQRQPGGEPVRQRFRSAGQFQRRPRHHDQVERAVLMIGREQAVEREQACQQRAEPEEQYVVVE